MSSSLPPPGRSPARRLSRVLASLAGLAALLYLAVLAALWFGQERLLFYPQPLAADHPLATAAAPDIHETTVEVPGARLSVLALRRPDPTGVVFFLHGNGGNLESWFVNADFYRQANYDLVMPDYRGYGKSSGRIESEAQLHADVAAVWAAVAPRYQGKRIVFYGRSLGTGLAAHLAASLPPGEAPDQTILVSPYFSMQRLAAQLYPWVPAPVLRYPLRTDLQLPRIASPLLLIHGDHDTLIPWMHSQQLRALAPAAQFKLIAGAGHADLQDFDTYRAAVRAALPGPR